MRYIFILIHPSRSYRIITHDVDHVTRESPQDTRKAAIDGEITLIELLDAEESRANLEIGSDGIEKKNTPYMGFHLCSIM